MEDGRYIGRTISEPASESPSPPLEIYTTFHGLYEDEYDNTPTSPEVAMEPNTLYQVIQNVSQKIDTAINMLQETTQNIAKDHPLVTKTAGAALIAVTMIGTQVILDRMVNQSPPQKEPLSV